MSDSNPSISVVAPMHNEEGNAKPLYLAIKNTMDRIGRSYEIIFVNDLSDDKTSDVLKEIQRQDLNFHYCDLEENVGENWALLAGTSKARGDVIITVDGDFQNDPAFIPHLLRKLDEGYRVVSGWRKNRRGGYMDRVLPSVVANFLISKISSVPMHDCGCGLKAYRREVLGGRFVPSGFMNRFSPVVFGVKPHEFCEVEIEDRLRSYGKSHYGLKRIFIVFNDLLVLPFVLRDKERTYGFLRKAMFFVLGAALISLLPVFFHSPMWLILTSVLTLAFLVFYSIQWNLARFLEAERNPRFRIKEFK